MALHCIALQTLSKSYGNPNEVRARSAHCARYECMLKMTIQTKINKVKTGLKKPATLCKTCQNNRIDVIMVIGPIVLMLCINININIKCAERCC